MAALEHAAILDGDHVLALPIAELGVLLDYIERPLGGALVDREQGAVAEEVERVVAPLAIDDLAAIEVKDGLEFLAVEGDRGQNVASMGYFLNRVAAPSGHPTEPLAKPGV